MVAGVKEAAAQINPLVCTICQGGIATPGDTVGGGEDAGALGLVEDGGEVEGLAVVEVCEEVGERSGRARGGLVNVCVSVCMWTSWMSGCIHTYIHTDINDLSTHHTMYYSPSPGTVALTSIWLSGFKRACTGRATNAVADNARAKRDDTVRIIYWYAIDEKKIVLLLVFVLRSLRKEGLGGHLLDDARTTLPVCVCVYVYICMCECLIYYLLL
jgi:hypothetical protein